MKTVKTIFVLSAMTLTFSVNVLAAGVRASEVRDRFEREARRGERLEILKGVSKAAELKKMSQELSKISSGNADQASLEVAMRRNLEFLEGTEKTVRTVSLQAVGSELLRLDQATRAIRNSRLELTKEGQEQLDAMENALHVATEFLALAGRTTETYKIADNMTPAEILTTNLFNKQLSILSSLGSMNATDLKAHTAVMKAATKYQGPRVEGDVAFNKALFYDVAKGNEAKYKEKVKDVIDCK